MAQFRDNCYSLKLVAF